MAQVKEQGGGGSRFISRAVTSENALPRSFFVPKLRKTQGSICENWCSDVERST